ncbi:OadG family protein [Defluviitalea phaphyphila]|uniref:OadG family protein n=1 Tax=Defluviitalea phaphyphila TaxID=1473580 RepID=UPI000730D059|nr:OadG family protein [Defluviitalea phaphyphila]
MEEFLNGLMVTVIGMGVTFIALIALSYILDLFRILSNGSSKKIEEPKQEIVKEEVIHEEINQKDGEVEDDLELIAVITAAVAASLNTTTDKLKVRSFRRINSNISEWNREGRISQIKNTI